MFDQNGAADLSRTAGRLRQAVLRTWSDGNAVPHHWHRSAAVAEVQSLVVTAAGRLRMPLAERPDWCAGFVALLTEYGHRAPAVHRG